MVPESEACSMLGTQEAGSSHPAGGLAALVLSAGTSEVDSHSLGLFHETGAATQLMWLLVDVRRYILGD